MKQKQYFNKFNKDLKKKILILSKSKKKMKEMYQMNLHFAVIMEQVQEF